MELQVCLDRFEGKKAVLLVGEEQLVCPRSILPPDASEGDILLLAISIDGPATEKARAEAAQILADLRAKQS